MTALTLTHYNRDADIDRNEALFVGDHFRVQGFSTRFIATEFSTKLGFIRMVSGVSVCKKFTVTIPLVEVVAA